MGDLKLSRLDVCMRIISIYIYNFWIIKRSYFKNMLRCSKHNWCLQVCAQRMHTHMLSGFPSSLGKRPGPEGSLYHTLVGAVLPAVELEGKSFIPSSSQSVRNGAEGDLVRSYKCRKWSGQAASGKGCAGDCQTWEAGGRTTRWHPERRSSQPLFCQPADAPASVI